MNDAIFNPFFLSLKISFVSIFIQTIPAIFFGWCIHKMSSYYKWIPETLIILPLVITPLLIGYFTLMIFEPGDDPTSFLSLLGKHLIFDWKGAVLVVSIISFPLYVQAATLSFANVDSDLEFASRCLGYNRFSTFVCISLPLAFRGILSGTIFAFARCLGEFGATGVIAGSIPGVTETMPLAMYRYINTPGMEDSLQQLIWISISVSLLSMLLIRWCARTSGKN